MSGLKIGFWLGLMERFLILMVMRFMCTQLMGRRYVCKLQSIFQLILFSQENPCRQYCHCLCQCKL
ncbi:hypothetical protein BHE74_00038752 [Ensete ventricosum]|nr:hypothetical protein BHE74_00038752 [Ensete ventricosum]